jgi:hypothetical protein
MGVTELGAGSESGNVRERSKTRRSSNGTQDRISRHCLTFVNILVRESSRKEAGIMIGKRKLPMPIKWSFRVLVRL